ncbi:hypothetical protein N9D31_03460, partial [Oligoflexaceae bacterium]|nr:hypothetical protein [Oligoflexaceae bacterium]
IPAERKSPAEVAELEKDFIIGCLAQGALALKYFWWEAWKRAGSVKMPPYRSYYFDYRPKFIQPKY